MSPYLRKVIKEARKLKKEDNVRVYQKNSYLDADNSFGAKIRQSYLGTFIFYTEFGYTKSFIEFY